MPLIAISYLLFTVSVVGSQGVIAANVSAANDWNAPGHVQSFSNNSLHNVETQLASIN